MANAVVEAYRQYQAQPRQSNTAEILALYQGQISRVRNDLNDTTAKMQAMEQHYGALAATGDAGKIMLSRLASLSQELTAVQFDALKAKSELDDAQKLLPPGGNGAASPPNEPMIVSADQEETLRAEMIQLESRLQELRQHYLPDHPAVVAVQQRIAKVNRSYAVAVQRRWSLIQKRQQDLQKTYDEEQKLAIDASARAADYARLTADADHFRKNIENIEARMQAIEVTRDVGGIEIDFLEPAQSAIQSQPHSSASIASSLLLGLLLGISLAMLREWMDDRLRSPEQARAAMGLRLLVLSRRCPPQSCAAVAAQRTALEPASAVAEAFGAIRACVFQAPPVDRSRTILITSPGSGEGKTTTAANLAIAIAQSGKRVLLIDAVLRDPSLHILFNVQQTSGLATVLGGQAQDVQAAIQPTTVNGLFILPSGPAARNPLELLNSPALPELLEHLAEQFDEVVIDAPSLIGEPDARIIAASCDLTLLVLRSETTTRRQGLTARNALAGIGAHLLGIIVTHVPGKEDDRIQGASDSASRRTRQPMADPLADEDAMDLDVHPA